MNSDGTNISRLTQDYLIDQVPTWSPDGKFLAFLTWAVDWSWAEIRIVDVHGCNVETLTHGFSRMVTLPVWSPRLIP
jgi:Tol biopolymer transport system component